MEDEAGRGFSVGTLHTSWSLAHAMYGWSNYAMSPSSALLPFVGGGLRLPLYWTSMGDCAYWRVLFSWATGTTKGIFEVSCLCGWMSLVSGIHCTLPSNMNPPDL